MARLWALRALEREQAGHSGPDAVATRWASWDVDPDDLGFDPVPAASLTEAAMAPTPVLDGDARQQIGDWLNSVAGYWATREQMAVLDGWGMPATGEDAYRILASEGFREILAIDRPDQSSGTVVIMVSADGLLASVLTHDSHGVGWIDHVRVAYNVVATDLRMLTCGVHGSSQIRVEVDEHPDRWGQPRKVRVGTVDMAPINGSGGSVRVQLAAIRAFGQPVVPWRYPVWGPVALPDGYHRDTRRIVALLPEGVHRMFGPHLTWP